MNNPISIAVVDDHKDFLEFFGQLFTRAGMSVPILAKNGKDYFEQFESLQGPLDVCFCDLSMPVMNGIEVAKNFSRLCPGVTLLATSMEPKHSYYVKEMLDAGAHAFISKAIDPNEVVAKVLEVCSLGKEIGTE